MSVEAAIGAVLLAALAGLDVVSVVQGLIARPLVAGTGAGLILGDPETGLRIGAALELFALDVVPVGASRYPDFAAAAVAAVWYGAGTVWPITLGAAVGLGLLLAIAGGTTIPAVRRWNARTARAHTAALAAGDADAVRRVHLVCLRHDLLRSLGVAVAGVGAAWVAAEVGLRPDATLGPWLTAAALGGGVWAAVHGAAVSARSVGRRRLAVVGAALGLLVLLGGVL